MRELELSRIATVGMGGRFKLTKGKTIGGYLDLATGRPLPGTGVDVVTGQSGWSDNIFTDNGLNKIAASLFNTISGYCHCGTGTAAENAADTSLATFLASTNTVTTSSETAQGSAPYYGKITTTYRFAQGDAEGIIAEVGISDQATTGDLISRARVKDGGGTPTTIEVLSDEWLDVTYEFRLYPDHVSVDGIGSVSYSGVSYDYTIRAANVTDYVYLRAGTSRGQGAVIGANALGTAYGTGAALGAVTSTPTGGSTNVVSQSDGSAWSAASYSNGTFARDVSLTIDPSDANTTGGVKALMFYTGLGTYQILFDPIIPKDASKQWVFVTNLAWTRATIP
jgi:hypothetical protein